MQKIMKIFAVCILAAAVNRAAGIDLTFFKIKPAYKIYFGQRRSLDERLYFLPCADTVLVISVGKTPVSGRGKTAVKYMMRKARIKAQNELETFISAKMSAENKVVSKNGNTTFFSSFSKDISREICSGSDVSADIASGLSADRKSYCCIIGKVFPKKIISSSFLN